MGRVGQSAFLAGVFCLAAGVAMAGPLDDLNASLKGRTGKAEIDNRKETTVLLLFGNPVKGGCAGDVRSAAVTIMGATAQQKGDTAAMDVAYEGTYEKTPCGKDSGAPEKKKLFGHYQFQLISKPFQKLQVTPGDLAPGFGEAASRDDESNRLAVDAIKNALVGAF